MKGTSMQRKDFERQIQINGKEYTIYDIQALSTSGIADINRLPFSIRILVENVLRHFDGKIVRIQDVENIARWQKRYSEPVDIPFYPARVLMQDFTGVPAVVDLAAMRHAVNSLGADPKKINPLIPVELVVDHSVQVDYFGTSDSITKNVKLEYERNKERYTFLKWAQKNFDNFKVIPPNSGICHQVNLEYLARVIINETKNGVMFAYPDSLVGTDSHTTMINGLGVIGWGVGGIEAEAVMLGQPYFMAIPEVVGVKLVGKVSEGITATDIVLTITETLRKKKVVEKFVEYFGPGVKQLSLTDRATIANMSPEYGSTMGFFPIDDATIEYLKMTGRNDRAQIVETVAKSLGIYYYGNETPEYSDVLEIDLSSVTQCLAGPARPQDRIELKDLRKKFLEIMGCEHERDADIKHISTFHHESGTKTTRQEYCLPSDPTLYSLKLVNKEIKIGDGSVVIAAITSCTNTSNPFGLIGAGLLARNAVKRGLKVPPYVKTSLVPGSRVVVKYLESSGLMPYLEALGFHPAGYGCTTCIGNSGPLHPEVEKIIMEKNLNVAAVLSGNRNFEARIHQRIKSNFLASPMLVVAFAITGRIDIDLTIHPVGVDPNGEPVFFKDILPSTEEIQAVTNRFVTSDLFRQEYEHIFEGDEFWKSLTAPDSVVFEWDDTSTYIRNPPYFNNFSLEAKQLTDIHDARVLMVLGDSVTTDHISPAGAIPKDYPAGRYLIEKNVSPADFNSYGARRGNHEVMMRGTFGNIRIKNQLVAPKEGSYTIKFPENKQMFVYDASQAYQSSNIPLLILAGKEYGTGSSRDWAAKGTNLLGIKATIVESYERIHRSNLVGMGVLPLLFKPGDSWKSLGLNGSELYTITGLSELRPRKTVKVKAVRTDGSEIHFETIVWLNTEIEIEYIQHGGILPYVLRKLLKEK